MTWGATPLWVVIALAAAACAGTAPETSEVTTATEVAGPPCAAVAGDLLECTLPSLAGRPYLAYLPDGHDRSLPAPVVVALHGGSGDAEAALRVTCPEGDLANARCLHHLGDDAGFITIAPSGASRPLAPNIRTWNAGGGTAGWLCVSGFACREDSDDVAHIDAVLDDLAGWTAVDDARVYAVGLSNGGAMAHRLACERAGRITAIAAVASANQFSTVAACAPVRPLSVMHIHGTEDPCWSYETSAAACLDGGAAKLGAEDSVAGWVTRNGCTLGPITDRLPNTADDGTFTDRLVWRGCEGDTEVQLLEVVGGGHTWPGGFAYRSRAGKVAGDFDSEIIWEFLSAWRR